jgi:probable rRNA maturation factor
LSLKIIDISLSAEPQLGDILSEYKVHLKTLKLRLERVLNHTLIQAYLPKHTELCVTLLDDAGIQVLNRDYRGKNKPTDVLSFALLEGEMLSLPDGIPIPLGDIMISVQTAVKQSVRGALPRLQPYLRHQVWGLSEELSFLALHGVLHLLGFDHEEENEAEIMESLEAYLLISLLPKLALPAPQPMLPLS